MAGFSKIYCIGGLGGFEGADGINPILLQIWVGDADRQWLEAHYFDSSIKPLGSVRTIIPERPDDLQALVDACIAFYPEHFSSCPSLPKVAQQLEGVTTMDFDLGRAKVTAEWQSLREEAQGRFQELNILEGKLLPVHAGRSS